MNERNLRSAEQIQDRLKSIQGAGSSRTTGSGEVEITVATLQDGYDLEACCALLAENGIAGRATGGGSRRSVVVAREASGQALELIRSHRTRLMQANPLAAGDFLVGILAGALGCGVLVPLAVALVAYRLEFENGLMVATVVGSALIAAAVGGWLGYLRCVAVSRRRRIAK